MSIRDRVKAAKQHEDNVKVMTDFSRRIYIGIAQYAYDKGLPFDQDAIRLLVANSLEREGYPKEVHKISIDGK